MSVDPWNNLLNSDLDRCEFLQLQLCVNFRRFGHGSHNVWASLSFGRDLLSFDISGATFERGRLKGQTFDVDRSVNLFVDFWFGPVPFFTTSTLSCQFLLYRGSSTGFLFVDLDRSREFCNFNFSSTCPVFWFWWNVFYLELKSSTVWLAPLTREMRVKTLSAATDVLVAKFLSQHRTKIC